MDDSVRVEHINWFGKNEAYLLLTDGTYECWAYCHPCFYSEGDTGLGALRMTGAQEAKISLESEARLEKLDRGNGLSYRVIAQVCDTGAMTLAKEGSVTVGPFIIDFVRFPGDVEIGDYVEFEVDRLDSI